MKKGIQLAALIGVVGATSYYVRPQDAGVAAGPTVESPEGKLSHRSLRASTPLLSRDEILSRLPGQLGLVSIQGMSSDTNGQMDIFRQFGALEGEAALDAIFERYQGSQGLSYAMAFAATGWMEKDLEAGIVAIQSLVKGGSDPFLPNPASPYLFQWKGVDFHSCMT